MNPIPVKIEIGTFGEVLVTLRLLECGVQAAPPMKDSGNDLIAIKGEKFRAIQVKTTTKERFNNLVLPALFHIVAFVQLVVENNWLNLEKSQIFLLSKEQITRGSYSVKNLEDYELSRELVDELFGIEPCDVEIRFIDSDNEENVDRGKAVL